MRQFWQSMEEPDQAALLRMSLGELSGYPELAVFHTTEVIGRAVSRLEAVLRDGVRRGEVQPIDVRTDRLHACLQNQVGNLCCAGRAVERGG